MKYLILSLITVIFIYGQDYFPNEPGTEWVYRYVELENPESAFSFGMTTGGTIIKNDLAHTIFNGNNVLVRVIDSLAITSESLVDINNNVKFDLVTNNENDSLIIFMDTANNFSNCDEWVYTGSSNQTIFNEETETRSYFNVCSYFKTSITFSKKFGVTRLKQTPHMSGEFTIRLIGCKLEGVEYGTVINIQESNLRKYTVEGKQILLNRNHLDFLVNEKFYLINGKKLNYSNYTVQ